MACPECDKQKRQLYNEQINKARQEGARKAAESGSSKFYIVETVNGIPGYRLPGDESIARLKTIDTVFLA